MKVIWFGVFIGVGFLMMFLFMQGSDSVKEIQKENKIIGTIRESGQILGIEVGPDAPVSEYFYKTFDMVIANTLSQDQLNKIFEGLPDGDYKNYLHSLSISEQQALINRIQDENELTSQEEAILNEIAKQKELFNENQTETVTKQVPTNELDVTTYDRQSGSIVECSRLHQCDIPVVAKLIDPNSCKTVDDEVICNKISPPYWIHISIDCEEHEWCNLIPIGVTEQTDKNGRFVYTFVAGENQITQDYRIKTKAWVTFNGIKIEETSETTLRLTE